MSHATDPELAKRLRRAAGHLTAVERMVAEGRGCLDVAQQLQAVIRALETTKRAMILHHIDHHLGTVEGAAPEAERARIAEFREIAKFL